MTLATTIVQLAFTPSSATTSPPTITIAGTPFSSTSTQSPFQYAAKLPLGGIFTITTPKGTLKVLSANATISASNTLTTAWQVNFGVYYYSPSTLTYYPTSLPSNQTTIQLTSGQLGGLGQNTTAGIGSGFFMPSATYTLVWHAPPKAATQDATLTAYVNVSPYNLMGTAGTGPIPVTSGTPVSFQSVLQYPAIISYITLPAAKSYTTIP